MATIGIRHIKKGETFINEGDLSSNMYWLQSGSVRLYKKKGSGFIELGVVGSGEILGEMSFLDNEPRSASAEAIQNCEVVEIPRGKFEEFMNTQPSWMKSLVTTLVKRMRASNNRLREAESNSLVYVKNEEGKSTRVHEFISNAELIRLCSAMLLAASRRGETQENGASKIQDSWVNFYCSKVGNVPMAKTQTFMDIFVESGMIQVEKVGDGSSVYLNLPDRLEEFVLWLSEEDRKNPDKQMQIPTKSVDILRAIHEYTDIGELENQETTTIDLEEVFQKACIGTGEKIPFDMSAFDKIVQIGMANDIRVEGMKKSSVFNVTMFQSYFSFIALKDNFIRLNLEKRKG